MRDIAAKLSLIGRPLKTDVTGTGFKSITRLLKFYRDSICHNDSSNRRNVKGYIYSHNVQGALYFPDEITIETGDTILHLRRHLFLSYIEALQIFASYREFQAIESFRFVLEIAQVSGALETPHLYRNSDQ